MIIPFPRAKSSVKVLSSDVLQCRHWTNVPGKSTLNRSQEDKRTKTHLQTQPTVDLRRAEIPPNSSGSCFASGELSQKS